MPHGNSFILKPANLRRLLALHNKLNHVKPVANMNYFSSFVMHVEMIRISFTSGGSSVFVFYWRPHNEGEYIVLSGQSVNEYLHSKVHLYTIYQSLTTNTDKWHNESKKRVWVDMWGNSNNQSTKTKCGIWKHNGHAWGWAKTERSDMIMCWEGLHRERLHRVRTKVWKWEE